MLEPERIQLLAQAYPPQELFAALVWQRRFNEFDGPEVITDLTNHPQLLFTKPIYAPNKDGLSFNGVLETLRTSHWNNSYRLIRGKSGIAIMLVPPIASKAKLQEQI